MYDLFSQNNKKKLTLVDMLVEVIEKLKEERKELIHKLLS